jgi:hypothetical protein
LEDDDDRNKKREAKCQPAGTRDSGVHQTTNLPKDSSSEKRPKHPLLWRQLPSPQNFLRNRWSFTRLMEDDGGSKTTEAKCLSTGILSHLNGDSGIHPATNTPKYIGLRKVTSHKNPIKHGEANERADIAIFSSKQTTGERRSIQRHSPPQPQQVASLGVSEFAVHLSAPVDFDDMVVVINRAGPDSQRPQRRKNPHFRGFLKRPVWLKKNPTKKKQKQQTASRRRSKLDSPRETSREEKASATKKKILASGPQDDLSSANVSVQSTGSQSSTFSYEEETDSCTQSTGDQSSTPSNLYEIESTSTSPSEDEMDFALQSLGMGCFELPSASNQELKESCRCDALERMACFELSSANGRVVKETSGLEMLEEREDLLSQIIGVSGEEAFERISIRVAAARESLREMQERLPAMALEEMEVEKNLLAEYVCVGKETYERISESLMKDIQQAGKQARRVPLCQVKRSGRSRRKTKGPLKTSDPKSSHVEKARLLRM